MEIDINTSDIVLALNRVSGIVEKTGATSHIKCESKDDNLVITATDQQSLTLVASYPAIIHEPGAIVIKAARFIQIARSSVGSILHIREQSNQKVNLECGKAKFEIHECKPVGDFPPIPEKELTELAAISNADLKRMIDETNFSISPEKSGHANLAGAALDLIEGEEDIRLRIVTTDTNRLSCSEAKFNIESDKIALFKNLWQNDQNHLKKIIPKKAVMQLRRLCDVAESEWTLLVDSEDREIVFQNGQMSLSILLSDSKFPPYNIILDRIEKSSSARQVATLSKSDIGDVLRRAKIFCSQNKYAVNLKFDFDSIVVDIFNSDIGTFEESIKAQFEGAPSSIDFNFNFLQDIIQSVEADKFRINFGHKTDPCLIDVVERNDCKFIVMPMRANR